MLTTSVKHSAPGLQQLQQCVSPRLVTREVYPDAPADADFFHRAEVGQFRWLGVALGRARRSLG